MARRSAALAGLAAIALLSACTGAPRPDRVAAGNRDGSDPAGMTGEGSGFGATDTSVAPGGDPNAPGGTGPGGTTAGGGSATAGGGRSAGGGTGGGGSGGGGTTPPPPGVRDATLWSGAANTTGITDTKITLCGHAALIFAHAFDTRPEDLNLYWQVVNQSGGIHGRTVEATYEDDQYSPTEAVNAANKCKSKNPFMLLGGIGFDQIPGVRKWADDNKMLYLHHIARDDPGRKHSFTAQPTVEETGTAFGEFITKHHRNERIGIVYRNSEFWEPGRSKGKAYMKAHGVNVAKDVPVEKNQSVYSAQINELNGQVDVVWIWENALGAAEFIKQAHNQGFHPTFVVFPFQTTLDVLRGDAFKSKIEGVATWSPYKPGGYGNEYAQHGYGAEIAKFEQAMASHRPGVKPNDILWQVWIGNKLLHDMLNRCGRDCTRNRMAGLMLSGYRSTVAPNCDVDFSRNPYRGGYQFVPHEATRYGNGDIAYYRATSWCAPHLN